MRLHGMMRAPLLGTGCIWSWISATFHLERSPRPCVWLRAFAARAFHFVSVLSVLLT
jgi:hypothetical protein